MGEKPGREDFEELYRLFRKAESAMKEVEEIEYELSVPPLNQLRYAGQHVLKFLGGEKPQDEEELRRARRHIQRAIYDSYEAGILGILEYTHKFQRIFGALPELREQIPEYDEFMEQADAAHDLIDQARETYESRETFYEETQPHFEVLQRLYRRLDRIKPVLGEILHQKKIRFRHYVIGVIGAIIGAILSYGITLLAAWMSS
ncbi:MAG: hypothetical protein JW849_03930 [Phycisphaerae bacterium]|nr:hypothetical protein [Phycisphaerae bacterium]